MSLVGRLEAWFRAEKLLGRSPAQALLRLPVRVAREGVRVVDGWSYRRGQVNAVLAKRFEQILRTSPADPYFVVAVPRILHFLVPCLHLASRRVPVVLVLNGVPQWEQRMLADTFPSIPQIRLPVSPLRGPLAHGLALELILKHAAGDLRLHDPDLYVFDPSVYGEIGLREREVAAGALGTSNERAGLTFPTTHLLTLRGAVLRFLALRDGINPGIYRRTPRALTARLRGVALGDDNLPKTHLAYWDVLHLLLAVAVTEGWTMRSLDASNDRVLHVGGVSYLTDNYHLDYLNHRFLALPTAAPFAFRYQAILGVSSIEQARARFRRPGAEAHLRAIDESVVRLTDALAS